MFTFKRMLLPIEFKMMTEFDLLEDRGVERASHARHCLINKSSILCTCTFNKSLTQFICKNIYESEIYMTPSQWCGNSQSCRTLFDKCSEWLVNLKLNCIQSIWEQGKDGENRSKCPQLAQCIHSSAGRAVVVSLRHHVNLLPVQNDLIVTIQI